MSTLWPLPPKHTPLDNNDVHVWCVWLNQSEDVVRCLFQTLSPDERDRATKFYFQQHRHSFIVARGILRKILGTYLHAKPDQLRFSYGSYGKPSLAEAQRGDGIRFNVSHSHELALYALTRRRDIGVDVEWRREDFDVEEVAGQFFSQQEIATLGSLPSNQQNEGFFNCWTRKEAYIKALGEGLSRPLNQFEVS